MTQQPCPHDGLFAVGAPAPDQNLSREENDRAYQAWLDSTRLCAACLQRVPNRDL